MAHHYQDFFMSYDWRIPKKNQTSGSINQGEKDNNKQNKEAECSDTEKQQLDAR